LEGGGGSIFVGGVTVQPEVACNGLLD
jgi:hypothetical protein